MILVPLLCAVVGIFLIRSTRFPAQESAGTNRLSGVLAASALLWVFGAVLAMFFVVLNLLVDVLQTLLDPRIARA